MDAPLIQIARFDTDQVPPDLRLEAWQENMGVLFDLSTEDGSRQDNRVDARIDVCSFGDTVFGVTEASSQLFARDERRIAREGIDHILVQVFLKGEGETREGVKACAGDMLVIDLDQPHYMLNSDFANLTLVLPRELHPQLSDLLAPLHGKRLNHTDPMVRHVGDHLTSLWENLPAMTVNLAETALTGSLGLLENWLSNSPIDKAGDSNVSAALGKVVRRYIERHLSEPMTPELIAAAFRISRSQLYRMFSSDGGVARYIWDRRLRRAMRMLTQAPYRRFSIIAIAFECGFSSEAHFSRAFRARYGLPPSRARSDAIDLAQSSDVAPASQKPYRTDLADWIRRL